MTHFQQLLGRFGVKNHVIFYFISDKQWSEQPTWSNQPKVGTTHQRWEQPTEGVHPPPLCLNLVGSCMESLPGRVIIHSNFA